MKAIKQSSKIILSVLCIGYLFTGTANAQGVAISTSSTPPANSAMLDVTSTTKGLLIPRMTSAQRTAIASPAEGLIVYETSSDQFYYYDGTVWKPLLSSTAGWNVTGNAGTSASTNFIGTTDVTDFVLRTANTERARMLSSGYLGIGLTAPTVKLQVDAGSSATLASGGYFMTGNSSTYNMVFDRDDIMARNNGAASDLNLNYNGGNVIINGSNSTGNVGIGTISPTARLEVINNTTSRGAFFHNSSVTNSSNVLRVKHDGTGNGIYCEALGTATTGIYCSQGGIQPYGSATVASTAGWSVSLGDGKGISAAGKDIGVEGCTQDDGNTNTDQLGGVFYVKSSGSGSSTTAFACVGSVVDNITYKILGFGIVSTVVNDLQDKPVVMASPEAPEALFQDFGTGQLVNGKVHITLDPILSKNIAVDEKHPIKIFIQLNDECNGVYVTNKSGRGFDVVELKNGNSNANFSWMITATRKNETRGGVTSDYENFRFKRTNNPGLNLQESSEPLQDIK